MSARTLLREWFWPRDGHSTAEIEASVREELESHVERMVEEQSAAGVPPDEARRQAAERFGDVDRYAAECRNIDLGDRLIVRRALPVACALLLAACCYLAWRVWESDQRAQRWEQLSAQAVGALERQLAAAANAPEPDTNPASIETSSEAWVKRLTTLRDHMHTAFGVAPDLTLLDPDEGLAILREAWPQITVPDVKTGLLKAFAFSKALPSPHPRLIQVLHLGMSDDDPEIRAYAAVYLEEYAHENFNDSPQGYAVWYREHRDMTPEAIRSSSDPTSVDPPRSNLGLKYR